jgi:hypothetical protein
MPIEYRDILMDGYQEIDAEQAQLVAELESCRLNDDSEGVRAARRRILELDGQRENLTRRANNFVAAQQNPQIHASFAGSNLKRDEIAIAQRYGLSANQMEAAMAATADPAWSAEAKAKSYVEGLQRYGQWRANNKDERDYQGGR